MILRFYSGELVGAGKPDIVLREPGHGGLGLQPVADRLADLDFRGIRVELRPRVAGSIQSTQFAEGGLVKAGDVLFKIDPAPYEAEVDKANAQLEAAKARVVFTQSELERGAIPGGGLVAVGEVAGRR